MRVLRFSADETGQTRFRLLHQGVCLGGAEGLPGGAASRKRAKRILDKMRRISAEVPDRQYPTGDRVRVLNAAGGTMVLDDEDFALLNELFDRVPWRIQVVDAAVDVDEFLAAAPDELTDDPDRETDRNDHPEKS
jgi:hypothetical protein